MKQKKYYKTWKFWITSLLALSASSIITSLALTSCVANDNVNKSDIVINSQTEDKEVSVDDNQGLTLSVEATSSKGEDLSYQWYVNKNSSVNENSWEKIAGATQKTYTISASDLQSATNETTWKYKAEIYHNNDVNKKVESKPISVKIKPSTGGSVPDKPIEPPTPDNPDNQEPTPPVQPPAPDVPSPSPTPPVQPPSQEKPNPPSSDIDNPGIVPSPEHKPSQGIGARLPLDKTGIVTTKYDQEKWIGDNSVSLMIEAKPNATAISNAINNFNDKTYDPNVKRMLNSLASTLNGAPKDYSYNQFGTGWILDYSNGSSGNLNDYYIATNMHVMSSYFTFTYVSSIYPNGSNYDTPVTVGVRIPFNETTVSALNIYISQPKYNLDDQKLNDKSYADQLQDQWYKTNVGINNWKENLIPLGAYNSKNGDGFNYSQAFDMELTWQYENNPNWKQTLYFKSSNNGFISEKPDIGNTSFQTDVDDFSVFKISLSNNAFDEKIKKNDKNKEMFERMKKLFDTTTIVDVKKESSYISKLNKLLEIVNNKKYTKETIDDLFMFGEAGQITNSNTQISIGGYPLIQERVNNGSSYKWQSYTTFNTNTLTGNNIIEYPPDYYHTRDRMGINQYTYKGNLYKIKWKGPNNFILKNVNLLAGSSGGLAIDKDYKISCINWGSYIHIEYHDGIKYVLDSSTSTGLYSSKDKNSLIWKWITYTKQNKKNTKLTQLFDQLEKINYFNK